MSQRAYFRTSVPTSCQWVSTMWCNAGDGNGSVSRLWKIAPQMSNAYDLLARAISATVPGYPSGRT